MNSDINSPAYDEERRLNIRFRIFCSVAIFSTVVFAVLTYGAIAQQYPPGQFPPVAGLWIYSIIGVLSGVSLVLGLPSFRSKNRSPIGILLGILVSLEFALGMIGVFQSLQKLALHR